MSNNQPIGEDQYLGGEPGLSRIKAVSIMANSRHTSATKNRLNRRIQAVFPFLRIYGEQREVQGNLEYDPYCLESDEKSCTVLK